MRLLPKLHPERPVYCIQAAKGWTEDALPASVDAAAERCITLIKEIQPTGPYYLVGHSFGGLLAHATACRLQAEDEPIALLATLDAFPRDIMTAEMNEPGYAQAVEAWLIRRLGTQSADAIKQRKTDQEIQIDAKRITRVIEHTASILVNFEPRIFRGSILAFVATISDRFDEGQKVLLCESWKALVTGHIDIHKIHSDHQDIVSPRNMSVIGGVLERHMASLNMA
jgi:thioesterase domain-containing protein